MMTLLEGKRGLVIGIANGDSIAAGCARAFQKAGAQLAVTYLNDKAKPFVQPIADDVNAAIFLPLDVEDDAQLDALFQQIEAQWGQLDFLLHSIAYCPQEDLHGRVTDCSRAGFAQAMDVSCHSFILYPVGEKSRTPNEKWRLSVDCELLRRRKSHRSLQRYGPR